MNSAKRGPAYGFKLPTFERLLDTKSTDRKQTLLHYVAHAIKQTYPETLEFLTEFEAMKVCVRLSLNASKELTFFFSVAGGFGCFECDAGD
jgi:hypothetical protein